MDGSRTTLDDIKHKIYDLKVDLEITQRKVNREKDKIDNGTPIGHTMFEEYAEEEIRITIELKIAESIFDTWNYIIENLRCSC